MPVLQNARTGQAERLFVVDPEIQSERDTNSRFHDVCWQRGSDR